MKISFAETKDLPAILKLQYEAYQSEAIIYDNYNIPPLTQTLTELQKETERSIILKAVEADVIIGSVRGVKEGKTCQIGRLIVLPNRQRQGIGSNLLCAIEDYFPQVDTFELFTGSKSHGNIKLYKLCGYHESKVEQLYENIEIIYMQKLISKIGSAP